MTYIAPPMGGALISKQCGTAKSAATQAFDIMMHQVLPVIILINSTEDRLVRSCQIDKELEGKPISHLYEKRGDFHACTVLKAEGRYIIHTQIF